jgi:hypothetical protein
MFFTMAIMIKCKFEPTCLKFTNATNVPKVNYACFYYELQQPPKGSFSCIEFWWIDKEISNCGL